MQRAPHIVHGSQVLSSLSQHRLKGSLLAITVQRGVAILHGRTVCDVPSACGAHCLCRMIDRLHGPLSPNCCIVLVRARLPHKRRTQMHPPHAHTPAAPAQLCAHCCMQLCILPACAQAAAAAPRQLHQLLSGWGQELASSNHTARSTCLCCFVFALRRLHNLRLWLPGPGLMPAAKPAASLHGQLEPPCLEACIRTAQAQPQQHSSACSSMYRHAHTCTSMHAWHQHQQRTPVAGCSLMCQAGGLRGENEGGGGGEAVSAWLRARNRAWQACAPFSVWPGHTGIMRRQPVEGQYRAG